MDIGGTEPRRGLEALLSDALSAAARASVDDHAEPPAPRFAAVAPSARTRRRVARWAAPLAAAAVVIGVVAGVGALRDRSDRAPHTGAAGASTLVATHVPAAPTVHVRLLDDDGATYGVAMPVIAYFSRMITDARPLQDATTATVNGKPLAGAWYFERSAAGHGPIEAHFRPDGYWPAHAEVTVRIPVAGLLAGRGLRYDDSLTLSFHTGARTIATVDGRTHQATVQLDDKTLGPYPVSVGATTRPGKAVIMDRPDRVSLDVAGTRTPARYAQRLTYGGEYLLSAPWNAPDIEAGVNSSSGSVDLLPSDARELFDVLRIGDLVQLDGVTGAPMTIAAGYGDWNLSWSSWLTGGLVRTH